MDNGTTVSGCGCSPPPASKPAGAPELGGTAKPRPALNDAALNRLVLNGTAPLGAAALGADWWDSAKGEIMTQALALSGYSTDPGQLRAYYRDHKQVIDDYLAHVDVGQVARSVLQSDTGQQGQQAAALFAAGAAFGVAGTLLWQRFSKDKSS